jgi:LPS export ABC transporter protein LptC
MLLSCENSIKEVKTLTDQKVRPELSGKEIEFVYTDSTRMVYRAMAPRFIQMNTEDDKYQEFPDGGKLVSYKEDGTVEWQIRANYAKNFEEDMLWELRNDVEAVTNDGKVINTELLYWDQKKQEIYSDKYVRITTADDQVLEGNSFNADEKFHHFTLRKVTGEVYLKNEKK